MVSSGGATPAAREADSRGDLQATAWRCGGGGGLPGWRVGILSSCSGEPVGQEGCVPLPSHESRVDKAGNVLLILTCR
jgi:hypothetical protein